MNTLYYGDNLDILRRYIKDESVDLIYLDPPFKSGRDYNILYKEANGTASRAQIRAFEDTWRWDQATAATYDEIMRRPEAPQKLRNLLVSLHRFLGTSEIMAYLVMMAIRLVELHRVLKRSGSIYLHCDPTASHYLKLVMDAVFGHSNYLNEIAWCYREREIAKRYWNRKHDILLFYCKDRSDPSRVFNWQEAALPYSPGTMKKYNLVDKRGRRYQIRGKGGPYVGKQQLPPSIEKEHPEWTYRDYLDEKKGIPPRDWLAPAMSNLVCPKCGTVFRDEYRYAWLNRASAERLGYPTQKPEALLDLIIRVSSKPGDIVLDPFCGCGTTISAAQRLGRRWIGIDITHIAITLIKHRLLHTFGLKLRPEQVVGEPVDMAGATRLAEEDPYQFQIWALGKVGARPSEADARRGPDRGIDGRIYFKERARGYREIIISVKGGKSSVKDVRELHSVVKREGAALGILITLRPPTKQMVAEAGLAGFYYHQPTGKRYPIIQIIEIEDLLKGRQPEYPASVSTEGFKKPKRHVPDIEQERLDIDG